MASICYFTCPGIPGLKQWSSVSQVAGFTSMYHSATFKIIFFVFMEVITLFLSAQNQTHGFVYAIQALYHWATSLDQSQAFKNFRPFCNLIYSVVAIDWPSVLHIVEFLSEFSSRINPYNKIYVLNIFIENS